MTDAINQLAKPEGEEAWSVDPAQVSAAALQDDLYIHADDIHGSVDQQGAEPNADAVAASNQVVIQEIQSDAGEGDEENGVENARDTVRYFEHQHDVDNNSLTPDEDEKIQELNNEGGPEVANKVPTTKRATQQGTAGAQ